MEKSGQGPEARNMNPLIIDRPDLQSWRHKLVSGLLTTTFWVVWIALWMPLVTLAGWVFFGEQMHFHMIRLEGYRAALDLALIYAVVIVALMSSLIVWAKYNHLRFRGVDRRKPRPGIAIEEIGRCVAASPGEVARWRSLRVMHVSHDEHGRISKVEDARPRLSPRPQPERILQAAA